LNFFSKQKEEKDKNRGGVETKLFGDFDLLFGD
jgi:hypothetical protein